MGKKNPFVFTIGFDKSDPDHVYVTELLNTTEKKAKLIVAAILAYTGRTDETGNGSADDTGYCYGTYRSFAGGKVWHMYNRNDHYLRTDYSVYSIKN